MGINTNITKITSVLDGNDNYDRYTIKSPLINDGDDVIKIFLDITKDFLKDGDIIMAAESPIAISEGRGYEFSKIKYGFFAKLFSKFVTKTPAGIGLGTPQTMQLAINEVGLPRIFFAAAVSAISRPFKKGLFYKIAGWRARGIDGPTANTMPPYNGYATLTPAKPEEFSKKAEKVILEQTGKKVKFIVIDANDIGTNILSDRKYKENISIIAKNVLAKDNPMGQGHESTPFVVCRLSN